MVTISYRGRPALHVVDDRACFTSWAIALERDHPIRRWVACMGFYALDVFDGHMSGPYSAESAELFARCALMPDLEFAALVDRGDAELAEHFNVPLEQVAAKRLDLAELAPDEANRR